MAKVTADEWNKILEKRDDEIFAAIDELPPVPVLCLSCGHPSHEGTECSHVVIPGIRGSYGDIPPGVCGCPCSPIHRVVARNRR